MGRSLENIYRIAGRETGELAGGATISFYLFLLRIFPNLAASREIHCADIEAGHDAAAPFSCPERMTGRVTSKPIWTR